MVSCALLRASLLPFPSHRSQFCSPNPNVSISSAFTRLVSRSIRLPASKTGVLRRPLSVVSLFRFGASPKLPELVEAGDPVLHEIASPVPVEEIATPRIQKIIDDMIAVMRRAPGVGLAGPQIAIPLQIIVLEDTKEYISYAPKEEAKAQQRYPFDLLVLINPTLRKKGHSTARFFEGCLSVDGFRGLVERHLEVEVIGFGRDGLPLKVEASGWQARILQHECDHLTGLLYVDKMIPRTFRTLKNLRLPLPATCPKPGVSLRHGGSIDLKVD